MMNNKTLFKSLLLSLCIFSSAALTPCFANDQASLATEAKKRSSVCTKVSSCAKRCWNKLLRSNQKNRQLNNVFLQAFLIRPARLFNLTKIISIFKILIENDEDISKKSRQNGVKSINYLQNIIDKGSKEEIEVLRAIFILTMHKEYDEYNENGFDFSAVKVVQKIHLKMKEIAFLSDQARDDEIHKISVLAGVHLLSYLCENA